jgi:hypothetical protein
MVAGGVVECCSGGVLHEWEGIKLVLQHKDGGGSCSVLWLTEGGDPMVVRLR